MLGCDKAIPNEQVIAEVNKCTNAGLKAIIRREEVGVVTVTCTTIADYNKTYGIKQ
jgi:hypothetical protein